MSTSPEPAPLAELEASLSRQPSADPLSIHLPTAPLVDDAADFASPIHALPSSVEPMSASQTTQHHVLEPEQPSDSISNLVESLENAALDTGSAPISRSHTARHDRSVAATTTPGSPALFRSTSIQSTISNASTTTRAAPQNVVRVSSLSPTVMVPLPSDVARSMLQSSGTPLQSRDATTQQKQFSRASPLLRVGSSIANNQVPLNGLVQPPNTSYPQHPPLNSQQRRTVAPAQRPSSNVDHMIPFLPKKGLPGKPLGSSKAKPKPSKATKAIVNAPKIASLKDGMLMDGFYLLSQAEADLPEQVHSLHLTDKNITMVLEEDLVHFSQLKYLDVSDNSCPLAPLSSFPSLRELKMHCNGVHTFTLPAPHRAVIFPRLQILDLSFNGMHSDCIAQLALLPALKVLDLSGNELSQIPNDWSQFRRLHQLTLAKNQLKDSVCMLSLSSAPELHVLDVSQNMLDSVGDLGRLHENAPCFPNLIFLDISRNYICTEQALLPLTRCSRLEALDVRCNLLVASLPETPDTNPTGVRFQSTAGIAPKSRVSAKSFPLLMQQLVMPRQMLILIENEPAEPDLPLPLKHRESADQEEARRQQELMDGYYDDDDESDRPMSSVSTSSFDVANDPDFQADMNVSTPFTQYLRDNANDKLKALEGVREQSQTAKLDVSVACARLRHALSHSVTHASPRQVTGEFPTKQHVATRTSIGAQLRQVPRHTYKSKFVDDEPVSQDNFDDVDAEVAQHANTTMPRSSSNMSRTVSRNWVIKGAGVCPYPSRLSDNTPDIRSEQQVLKSSTLLTNAGKSQLVNQLKLSV